MFATLISTGKNGTCVQILTKYTSDHRVPNLFEEAPHLRMQLGIGFRSIKPALLLTHIRSVAHRELFRDSFLLDRRPFPKRLREDQLSRIGSFHAWQVLCNKSRCRQSVFHPPLRMFLTVGVACSVLR